MEKFECTECKKNYSSKKSLSNHNRINHGIKKEKPDNYNCKVCNKSYALYKSKWKHEQSCTKKQKENNQIPEPIKKELDMIKQENETQKQLIIELQHKLKTSKRLDTKTFKAVNKILMDRSYNANNNVNSNNQITNNNNYQILSLGSEELCKVLTIAQKKEIMRSRLGSIEKIVEIAHCGEYNQFKNIIITNLKDNFAYRYNDKKGYFESVSKDILLENLVMSRVMDIEEIYDELQNAKKIDVRTKKLIQDFLDKMSEDNVPFVYSETKYNNFKSYKMNNIKVLLYNNHDKITKDIALLISNEENNVINKIDPPLTNTLCTTTETETETEDQQEDYDTENENDSQQEDPQEEDYDTENENDSQQEDQPQEEDYDTENENDSQQEDTQEEDHPEEDYDINNNG